MRWQCRWELDCVGYGEVWVFLCLSDQIVLEKFGQVEQLVDVVFRCEIIFQDFEWIIEMRVEILFVVR